jgi:hypothetical protein
VGDTRLAVQRLDRVPQPVLVGRPEVRVRVERLARVLVAERRLHRLDRAPGAGEFGGSGKELAAGDLPALDALRSVQVPGGVSVSVWLKAADTPEGTFYDRRARLVNRGLVTNLGTDRAPRYFVPEDEEEI